MAAGGDRPMTVDGTSSGSVAGQQVSSAVAGQAARGAGLSRVEVVLAVAAFALLCVAVLSVAPQLVEPDDAAYRGSILAITQGHVLTPVHRPGPGPGRAAGPRRSRPGSRWSRRRPRGHGPVAVGATAGRALDQREGPRLPVPRCAVSGAGRDPAGTAVLWGAGLSGPVRRRAALARAFRRRGGRRLVLLLRRGATVRLA